MNFNIKAVKPWIVLGALVLIWMNFNLFTLVMGGGTPEDTAYTAVTLSLLPAAALILALVMLRGESKLFKVGVGVMAMSYAWEFIADPWSVTLRMDMGLSLTNIMIYNAVGSIFLIIAVLAFKQVG